MPCYHDEKGTVTICSPTWSKVRQPVLWCFNCKVNRRCLSLFQEWYGWTITCLTCGDSWADGEVLERPFQRGWRKEAVARAKELWERYKDKTLEE